MLGGEFAKELGRVDCAQSPRQTVRNGPRMNKDENLMKGYLNTGERKGFPRAAGRGPQHARFSRDGVEARAQPKAGFPYYPSLGVPPHPRSSQNGVGFSDYHRIGVGAQSSGVDFGFS